MTAMTDRELLLAFLAWLANTNAMHPSGVSFCGTGYAGEQIDFGMNHEVAVDTFLASRPNR